MFWGYPVLWFWDAVLCYDQRASELLVYSYIVYNYPAGARSLQSTQDVEEVIFGPVKKISFFEVYIQIL